MEARPLEREIILDFGKTGMGKTRWARQHLRSVTRQILMDPMLEYSGLAFEDLDHMIDYLMEYPTFRVKTEFIDDFPRLCAIAMAARRCTLVVEETQRVLPASRKELPVAFEEIVYRGRHRRVSLLLISQRPSTVHIAARSQWTRIIAFNQTEPADAEWIQSVSGFDLDLSALPPSTYYEITPTTCVKKILLDTGAKIPAMIGEREAPDEPAIPGDDVEPDEE